jgi:LIVCS family branched-chain amino acid:cation transporter
MMTNLGFRGIMGFVAPMVTVCYPALIVLALVNIAHKLFGFRQVRGPVFATFLVTLASQFWFTAG